MHWALTRAVPIGFTSVALATLGSILFPPLNWMPPDVPDVAFIEALVRWDAGWYGEIANNGYWLRPGEQSPVAFFPLYPLLIRTLTFWFGLNRWVAGIAVSFLSAMGGLFLFSRWARQVAPPVWKSAFWLLALYPFAEYLYGVVYSDALFLLMAVSAFLALEKDQHVLSALLGALACACRPVAPAVVIGLLVRSLERRRGQPLRVIDFVPALAGLGLVAWMTYLEVRFDDPIAFATVQAAPGWAQPPGWHSWLKLEWFKTVFDGVVDPRIDLRLGGHALVTALALVMVVPTFKKLGWGYGVYTLLVVGIPAVSSKDFQGLGRYVIAAFPLFLTAAFLMGDRPRVRRVVFGLFASLLVALALALGAGVYVA